MTTHKSGLITTLLTAALAVGCGNTAKNPTPHLDGGTGGCTGTQIMCNNACTDTMTDANNCGSCGNVCTADMPTCSGGQCTAGQMMSTCTPLLNTGCAAGTKCEAVNLDANNKIIYGCVSAGTDTPGASCMTSMTGDSCISNAICLGSGGSTGTCYAQCGTCDPSTVGGDPCPSPNTAMYCGQVGGQQTYCINVISDGMMHYLGLICNTSCDPLSGNTPCTYQDANGNNQTNGNCFYIPGGPVCDAAGTVATGAACMRYSDCVAGDSCFQTGAMAFTCQPNCDKTKNNCPTGMTCTDAMNMDIPNLGYCK